MRKKRKPRHRAKHARKNTTRVWPVVLLAVIVTVIALIAVFGQDIANFFKARDTQDELQELYRGANAGSILDMLMPRAIAEELPDMPIVPPQDELVVHEDFEELYEKNPHIVGWLSAGESIDYPVVQHDNEFYLEHDYFGKEDSNGTLFVNAANNLNPRDSILLIHGHNMKSGAMFGDLDYYREYDYLAEHPIITFRTIWDEEDVYYVPIAAFDASMTKGENGYFNIGKIRFEFDIPADENIPARSSELEEYIAQMREMSFWDSPVEADSTDQYITLVTCSYSHDNGRMMLVCRKLREGETTESIRGLFD